MRQAFIKKLVELARKDDRIVLMTGDLGYLALEPFIEEFPDRFVNCGVAEQNMVGVATGLAEAGFLPFVYSIVTFATLRCFEFIRNGPVAHGLPVRIVGVGGGVEYGHNGPSHYGLEDVGVMRLLEEIEIYCPLEAGHAACVLEATYDRKAPIYYRLGKDEKAKVSATIPPFHIGRADRLSEGEEALLISMGALAVEGQIAVEALGGRCAHWGVSSMTPFPTEDIREALERYPLVVTAEAHRNHGGLGSAVAEVAAGSGAGSRVVRLGISGFFEGKSGSQGYLYEKSGISPSRIAETILKGVEGA